MTFVGRRPRDEIRTAARRIATVAPPEAEPSHRAYRWRVKTCVARLASRMPVRELYHRCLGAFPKVVKESVLELMSDGYHPRMPVAADDMAIRGAPTPWEDDELDLIDSQWYFDASSAGRVLSFLPEGAKSVVALGTPTVAALAAARVPEVQLLDNSPRFQPGGQAPAWADLRKIEVRWCDLDDKPVSDITRADMVVMDPPWHLENYQAWLRTAVQACVVGGLLAVVMPQPLTNRKAQSERRELRRILRGIGRVTIKPNILSYVTPSFEEPVLDTDGLRFLRRWRRADLALVQVQRPEVAWESPRIGNLTWNHRWMEGRIVRTWGETAGGSSVPVIAPADPLAGYRLASVGRTYLRSSGINLVTSRGRAAIVTHWGRLPEILDLLEDGLPVDVAAKAALPEAPASDLAALITTLSILLER